ncbi:FG-GAP repeat domain-containing protein [Haliangium sp.]|uniref:FG-GAP repeat domain-containing protein n=1 Tax=Haliangium sp. TaxID=2663208 RepID=UPI003D0B0D6D
MQSKRWLIAALTGTLAACSGGGGGPGVIGGNPAPLPAASCEAGTGGSTSVSEPVLVAELGERYHEAWQGSPAVVDLDGDGVVEILSARHGRLNGWHADGELVYQTSVEGRIWASPVVVDLRPDIDGLEVAVAARGRVYVWDASGEPVPGFPAEWRDELRSLAAGDIDGDGAFELVAVTTSRLESGGQRDVIIAFEPNGQVVAGFPPNTTGASGCDDHCWPTGGFDQNIALGDLDGDGVSDIFVPHDNAYVSVHDGTGRAFDAAEMFEDRTKIQGVRFMHDYADAAQGFADDEESANQAHFTNSAPAIADIDGDGDTELVVVGSVQNASQDDRLRGVALWVVGPDGTRSDDWLTPFHVPEYLAGLEDLGGNVVGLNNEVTVVDIDPDRPGLEMIFAGYDGLIHCVDAAANEVWSYRYSSDDRVLTGGVVVADLSRDGIPEVVFASYSPDQNKSHLFVLDAGGNELHKLALPQRGAMPVPTIADADADGQLEIVVSLKGNDEDGDPQVHVYTVDGSSDNCLPWPTGRANLRRDGYVQPD